MTTPTHKAGKRELGLVAGEALLLFVISWLAIRGGISLGAHELPQGPGLPSPAEAKPDLFRFDSVYYRAIADWGYVYDGNPASSPNLVFAPLFPLLLQAVAALTGLELTAAGFLLNRFLLVGALFFWILFLRTKVSPSGAFLVLLLLVTSAGSYAFHAYYSEATLFFFLGLCFWSYSQGWAWLAAFSCAALGASRLTAFPIVCVFAGYFLWRAWCERSQRLSALSNTLLALLCLTGTASYLAYLGREFGNPFTLIPEIQQTSWGRFHQGVSWPKLLTGFYFIEYAGSALQRGWGTFLDIRTINLAWMLLGLGACVHLFLHYRRSLWALCFIAYFAMIYWSDAGSEYLISSHRFLALMVPIFMMILTLHETVMRRCGRTWAFAATGLLSLINLGYGLLMTAAFNQGLWPYF